MSPFVSLMYHNVCARRGSDGAWPGYTALSPSITGYFVDREMFARHCAVIAATGRCVGSKATYPESVSSCDDSIPPAIQITFDDGWRGTFDEAGPLLEAHGLRAIVFATTDLIGHPDFANCHLLATASPTFSIGAHGRTHRPLATLSDRDVREELATSKATLEDILGREVDELSFPGGSFNDRVVRIARELGYRKLFTSQIHMNRRMSSDSLIGRVPIKAKTDQATITRYIAGNLRPERLRDLTLRTMKGVLGQRGYAAVRARLIGENSNQLEMTDLSSQSRFTEVTS